MTMALPKCTFMIPLITAAAATAGDEKLSDITEKQMMETVWQCYPTVEDWNTHGVAECPVIKINTGVFADDPICFSEVVLFQDKYNDVYRPFNPDKDEEALLDFDGAMPFYITHWKSSCGKFRLNRRYEYLDPNDTKARFWTPKDEWMVVGDDVKLRPQLCKRILEHSGRTYSKESIATLGNYCVLIKGTGHAYLHERGTNGYREKYIPLDMWQTKIIRLDEHGPWNREMDPNADENTPTCLICENTFHESDDEPERCPGCLTRFHKVCLDRWHHINGEPVCPKCKYVDANRPLEVLKLLIRTGREAREAAETPSDVGSRSESSSQPGIEGTPGSIGGNEI